MHDERQLDSKREVLRQKAGNQDGDILRRHGHPLAPCLLLGVPARAPLGKQLEVHDPASCRRP